MNIFPSSPVWANITRVMNWGEEIFPYDSGLRQGSTALVRPLWQYNVQGKNYNEIKQSSLEAFLHSQKGMVTPFLFKDPYDFIADNITQPTSTNMNNGSGFHAIEKNGYRIIPDSGNLLITDGTSGALTNGVEFAVSLDNGFITTLVVVTSTWTSSFEFFQKSRL